jgi:hypothetical protein
MTGGHGGALEGEALWEALRPALEAALAELIATRQQEGRALAADIAAHRDRLVELAARLREATLPLADPVRPPADGAPRMRFAVSPASSRAASRRRPR